MGIREALERALEAVTGDESEVMGEGYLQPAIDETVGEPTTQGLAQQGIFTLSDDRESIGAPTLDESRETVLPASEDPDGMGGDEDNLLLEAGVVPRGEGPDVPDPDQNPYP